ncbi:MAG: membrane protein insertion efficiency factor YidD [Candidatus Marinimicrobia bacterium]|nr:membrane protein insertion efficiency factor YidD [Candidatus Neomarinimicrobiota bacterium]
MKIFLHFLIIFLFFLQSRTFSQSSYPADSVLTSEKTSIPEKVLVAPIALWQRLSYNTSLIRCQFYPCCSNYAAQAISQQGILLGSTMASERIIRCNPFAFHYHLKDRESEPNFNSIFHPSGRLFDPIPQFLIPRDFSGKPPLLAAALSAILPGAGRIYVGRF